MNAGEIQAALVHVKSSAMAKATLCGYNADATWTSPESAEKVATCAECLREVLLDNCSFCNNTGDLGEPGHEECCGFLRCPHCDIEMSEAIIAGRSKDSPPGGR